MENVTGWVWLLAGASVLMALTAAFLFLYLQQQARAPTTDTPRQQPSPAPAPAAAGNQTVQPAPAPPPDTQAEQRAMRVRGAAKALQQFWFVVFEAPSSETNRQLAELLKRHDAFYDTQLGVYYIGSQHSTYQLAIAHSASPGTLPPLHQDERISNSAPLAGISVLIKFISKRSVARHPDTFIEVMLAAQRIGGSILNSEHQPLTPEDFTALFEDL